MAPSATQQRVPAFVLVFEIPTISIVSVARMSAETHLRTRLLEWARGLRALRWLTVGYDPESMITYVQLRHDNFFRL